MKWLLPLSRLCCMVLGTIFLVQGFQTFGIFQFLDYFTYLSNVVVVGMLLTLILGVCGRSFFLYGTVYISVTFLIYTTLLSPGLGEESMQSLVLHFIVPLFVIFDFFIFSAPKKLSYKKVLGILGFPLLYGAYVLIYGSLTESYPYFFVDVTEIGYVGFLKSALLMALGFVVLGGVFTLLNNVRCTIGSRKKVNS